MINAFEDPPIAGNWKGTADSRPDARMEIELDGEGSAHFSVRFEGDVDDSTNAFDVVWEQSDESRYGLDFECESSTHPQGICAIPFTLRCEIHVDADELECVEKTGVWTVREFYWELD